MSVFWNAERVDELRRMVAGSFSASKIGDALGCTRNAVIGKVHRLGLNLDGFEARRRPSGGTKPVRRTRKKTNTPPHPSPQGGGGEHPAYRTAKAHVEHSEAQALAHKTSAAPRKGSGNNQVRPRTLPCPVSRHLALEDLRPFSTRRANDCRWAEAIIGVEPAVFTFCGCETAPGESWCAHHAGRVFQPFQPKVKGVNADG